MLFLPTRAPKASDIPDDMITEAIEDIRLTKNRWTHRWDLEERWPHIPPKVLLAKARQLIKRKVITGCGCGCRGDYELAVGDTRPRYDPAAAFLTAQTEVRKFLNTYGTDVHAW